MLCLKVLRKSSWMIIEKPPVLWLNSKIAPTNWFPDITQNFSKVEMLHTSEIHHQVPKSLHHWVLLVSWRASNTRCLQSFRKMHNTRCSWRQTICKYVARQSQHPGTPALESHVPHTYRDGIFLFHSKAIYESPNLKRACKPKKPGDLHTFLPWKNIWLSGFIRSSAWNSISIKPKWPYYRS